MSLVEIVSLVVFVLAGALFGYKAWVQKGPIPNPPAVGTPVEPSLASPPVFIEPGPGEEAYGRKPVFPLEGPEPPSVPPTDPGH